MREAPMNGAESLVHTLADAGVEVCFANPGTSEMHFVAALDREPRLRPVLGLFEGAVTGMADGYGRMAGKPAATLLHLGPGLANGLANLHNARRAATPIVNIVGDHATYHAQYDAPLASDVAGFARPVSAWVHSSTSALTVAADGARAVAAALAPPGGIATLILPADTAWNAAEGPAPPLPVPAPAEVGGEAVDRAVRASRAGARCAILIRGAALDEAGLASAGRIAEATGARLMVDTFVARLARGAGRVQIERIPYFAEQIVDFLAEVEELVLVGARPPVAFFAYPGKPSWGLPPGARITYLAHPHEDGKAALLALAEAVGAGPKATVLAPFQRPDAPSGPFNPYTLGQVIARHLPEGAIFSDEGATGSLGTVLATATATPHDHLGLTGGSIGQGVPLATGAAIAAPSRKVVCLQGDGGAMYTLQALWTQAREKLDVTTVILANRAYAILQIELHRVGALNAGPKALSMFDLTQPNLDFVALAKGLGVEAGRAETIEAFEAQFAAAMAGNGPRLIEAVMV
ncbi:MAG TPA: acetolactate synthase large subunit [Caulobacteraceae bacterium]|jgi:acetolactate synthase-1/2/3 large subunit|nr:acetolactate synthase large subunit [Caulobacteraceae bacterium]